MVKQTFTNLPAAKKKRIDAALLREFSGYPLASAQVARIVKDADIARGAFYKYFEDIEDAYKHVFFLAMDSIHSRIRPQESFAAQPYYQMTVDFINKALASRYFLFIKMYFRKNENALDFAGRGGSQTLDAADWAAMILCHAAIKRIMVTPSSREHSLKLLWRSLELLSKGDKD